MRLTANAQQVAAEILEAFKSGAVPKALAQTFLTRHLDSPCSRWSWRNRLIVALRGHADARGFRQWRQVGRHVRAGAKAFLILGPMVARSHGGNEAEDPGDDRESEGGLKIIGFRGIAVFGYNQTEGEPLPALDRAAAFLETLPLLEVAHRWGLVVKAIAPGGGRLGYYLSGIEIGLAVENLSTWTHELVHAADDRQGTINRAPGQRLDNEVVAELGGAVLLECLGHTVESDRGGAYEYIESYCREHSRDRLSVCTELLERTCSAVELILSTAEALSAQEEVAA
jgi:hypothetical protein